MVISKERSGRRETWLKRAKQDLFLFIPQASKLYCFESPQRACIHLLFLHINFENQTYRDN